jgi:hypothetical protein
MAINYLRRVQARYQPQGQNEVSQGIAAGEAVGKLLGNLGTAIQGAQKNALANKLMNTVDAPRAALVNTGGPQPGGPQPSQGVDSADPNADLSTDLPEDVSQSVGGTAPILNQAVAASRLSQPSGNTGPDPDPDPTGQVIYPSGGGINMDAQPTYVTQDMPDTSQQPGQVIAQTKAANSLTQPAAQPSIAPGVSTAGTSPHTGGVAELGMMKEQQQMEAAKATAAATAQKNALSLADAQAKASGTGRYAMDAAIKRAQLLAAQTKALNPKTAVVKPEDMPINNINDGPVDNQGQLNKYVDTKWGKGAAAGITSTVMNPEMIDDPKNPGTQIPNPNGPQVSADGKSITVGPKNKRITMPIGTAQTLVKQQNSLNYKQKQPLLRVPGEDQTQGSQENPYPVKSKLDMVSRASGTWVRLPSGQIAQVP